MSKPKYIDAKQFWNRLISVSENDWVGFDTIDEVLSGIPSAERHGRWEFNIDDEGWSWDYPYMCDQCGEWVEKVFKFCPSCGAKMEGEEE